MVRGGTFNFVIDPKMLGGGHAERLRGEGQGQTKNGGKFFRGIFSWRLKGAPRKRRTRDGGTP